MLSVNGVTYLLKQGGRPIRFRYYSETIGSVWDDDRTLAKSGNDYYTSGLFQQITPDTVKGSDDAQLIEEGRIRFGDMKCYVSGNIPFASGSIQFTLSTSGVSSVETIYRNILPGLHSTQYFGQEIMNVLYLRELSNGSLF